MLLQFCHRLARSVKPETGAINTTGALVGLVVTGAVGGVAVTSSSQLIGAAHDAAAQQNAAQVGTAQQLAKIMDGRFMDLTGLENGGHMPAYRAAAGPRRFATQAGTGGTCFVTVSRSATGKTYFATDLIPTPEPYEPGAGTGCLPEPQVQAMAGALDAAAAAAGS